MPYNGSGTFLRLYSWQTDQANDIMVDASRMDADTNDIASGLSQCVTKDGQSGALTANLQMGSFKITGLASGSASTDAVNFGQVFTNPAFTGSGSITVNWTVGGVLTAAGVTSTGTVNLTGATTTVATPTLSTHAVTKAYADALSVAAGNVPIGGTINQVLKKNSSTNYDMSWAAQTTPGLTLLATLTPTAAANVDFLSTFSSTYDNYLIVGEGLKAASDQQLSMRIANAGTSDTGSNYLTGVVNSGSSYTATATSILLTNAVYASGIGASFKLEIVNANAASSLKQIIAFAACQDAVTPSYFNTAQTVTYKGAAASGVRFFWTGAANFSAQGVIRVYGYSNT